MSDREERRVDPSTNASRSAGFVLRWATRLFAIAIVYVLSSGPVLAFAFWLRDKTDREEFYGAMWLYAPLLIVRFDGNPIEWYIEWCVRLLGTSGPG